MENPRELYGRSINTQEPLSDVISEPNSLETITREEAHKRFKGTIKYGMISSGLYFGLAGGSSMGFVLSSLVDNRLISLATAILFCCSTLKGVSRSYSLLNDISGYLKDGDAYLENFFDIKISDKN